MVFQMPWSRTVTKTRKERFMRTWSLCYLEYCELPLFNLLKQEIFSD